jgi:4-hydroxybenzoate polyprenyltransferase
MLLLDVDPMLRSLLQLVKFEHTLFALPFALTALWLAVPLGEMPAPATVGWVLGAMVGGRTFAMALNRLIDLPFDAANPRTANRELVTGQVSQAQAWGLVVVSLAVLIACVLPLPLLCLQLLPVAILLLAGYSYTKRFTPLCHGILGIALGSSAIGGWLAHTGHWDAGLPVLLGLAVTLWVAGFDIIYALQDEAFDRQSGLHSLPAWLGGAKALALSRGCHVATVLLLVVFALAYSQLKGFVGWGFVAGVVIMAVLLVRQHRLVSPQNLSQVDVAFFTLNGIASVALFTCVLVDRMAVVPWLVQRVVP